MASLPLIGICGGLVLDKHGRFPDHRLVYVNEHYTNSVINSGGAPLILPINKDLTVNYTQIKALDGLILTGGEDVNPLLYNEEPLYKQGPPLNERDLFEESIIQLALDEKLPILGICRGMQILNVFFGGTLYQDMSYAKKSYIRHEQFIHPYSCTHTVFFKKGSFCYPLYGSNTMTNSFHHQGIKKIAREFDVVGRTEDGMIEAIENTKKHLIFGVQWHPEMSGDKNKIFDFFIKKTKQNLKRK